jgi:hypothetical protein
MFVRYLLIECRIVSFKFNVELIGIKFVYIERITVEVSLLYFILPNINVLLILKPDNVM